MTDDASSPIAARLREAGRRMTTERELLFDIVSRHPHLDAGAIYRLAVEENPKLGLATVYRTLSLLAELDLVEVSALGEDHGHYEIRGDDHVHLVCLSCGEIREVAPMPDLRRLGEAEGFDVREARLELVGYCLSCQRRRSGGKAQEDEAA
ncbi:Fur family transcriptional regulator [Candidatus Bipolaricaulota bacterium]